MSDELVQLALRRAECLRQPRGSQPFFEFHLMHSERIVAVEHYWKSDFRTRATVDHHIMVWVEDRVEVATVSPETGS
jgi:hypothetical protein